MAAGTESTSAPRATLPWGLALVVAAGVSGCLFSQVREDIAIIEGGDADIYKIDGVWLPKPSSGKFEVRPGGHTVDVTAIASKAIPLGREIHRSGLTSLCVKARGGQRYRIKAKVIEGRIQIFFVDAATGQPPKTPCGPDEDDD